MERIRGIVRASGFEPDLVGGVYLLQGRLARMVTASLLSGLVMLLAIFVGMAWLLSRSWRPAVGVLAGLSVIPVCMLGVMGHLRVPFDVISTPGANIAISMGVDSMMHLLCYLRHHASEKEMGKWESWADARAHLWQPIFCTALIVCGGFGVFMLSAFPPTQRFGFSIVVGTVAPPLASLFIFPLFAAPRR